MSKRTKIAFVPVLALGMVLLVHACGNQSGQVAEEGFALGAFPPVLSDTDYHEDSWTRDDCLTCHEKGKDDAPITKHESGIVDHAKDAKCRTCHVFVVGQPPVK